MFQTAHPAPLAAGAHAAVPGGGWGGRRRADGALHAGVADADFGHGQRGGPRPRHPGHLPHLSHPAAGPHRQGTLHMLNDRIHVKDPAVHTDAELLHSC